MRFKCFVIVFSAVILATACSAFLKESAPLPTVSKVDLNRYVGQWYAVTSLPQFFTRKCVAQDAVYGLNSRSEISVKNICIKKDGNKTEISGFARATAEPGVFALKFTSGIAGFFGASGDYNIIKLDPDYRYSLIGGKDRQSLWLLARTTDIDKNVLNEYIGAASELGFDVSELVDSKR
ncbi:MAG: lipocalin family protein [Lysobacterales bacterium]